MTRVPYRSQAWPEDQMKRVYEVKFLFHVFSEIQFIEHCYFGQPIQLELDSVAVGCFADKL